MFRLFLITSFLASTHIALAQDDQPLAYTSMEEEQTVDSLPVEGEIPPWLCGTLIRNGPAKFEAEGTRIDHWFDGLAMLEGFTFAGGSVAYVNRYLRSDNYHLMMEAGSTNSAGFGTSRSEEPEREPAGGWSHIHNANVNVAQYDALHVALTEVPLPVIFDLATLETLGLLEYADDLPKSGVFESAHPECDPRSGEQISFLVEFGPTSYYRLYRIPPGMTGREVIADIPTDSPSYMHSFSITENYIVLSECPLRFDFQSFLDNPRGSFLSHFKWLPERGTVFTVVDRHTGDVVASCPAESFFSWHHVNAFEVEGGLIVDLVVSSPPFAVCNMQNGLMRFFLEFEQGSAQRMAIFDGSFEMPWIREDLNGQPYRFVYGTANNPIRPGASHPLYKIDVHTRRIEKWCEGTCYPGEPVFVASPSGKGEDDGMLLSLVLDEEREKSFLLVLDAKTMQEVARAHLPHFIPRGLHGAFFQQAPK